MAVAAILIWFLCVVVLASLQGIEKMTILPLFSYFVWWHAWSLNDFFIYLLFWVRYVFLFKGKAMGLDGFSTFYNSSNVHVTECLYYLDYISCSNTEICIWLTRCNPKHGSVLGSSSYLCHIYRCRLGFQFSLAFIVLLSPAIYIILSLVNCN